MTLAMAQGIGVKRKTDSYLGVDVGLVTTKCAVITEDCEFIAHNYLCTQGKPVSAGQQGLGKVQGQLPADARIS